MPKPWTARRRRPGGLYFFLRRNRAAGAVCLAWAGTSAQNASVYIADAPFQRLALIGREHDWAFVLGPEHLNGLGAAHTIAAVVAAFGLLMVLTGLATCGYGLLPPLDRRAEAGAAAGSARSPRGD
jgi:hypothetical protein